jgi:hypothetical protein
MTPAKRLRKFEDDHFGDTPRVQGKIQRGHGSQFQNLSDKEKAEYAALENLVAAQDAHQQAVSHANAALQRLHEAAERAGVDPDDLDDEPEEAKEPEPQPEPPVDEGK